MQLTMKKRNSLLETASKFRMTKGKTNIILQVWIGSSVGNGLCSISLPADGGVVWG